MPVLSTPQGRAAEPTGAGPITPGYRTARDAEARAGGRSEEGPAGTTPGRAAAGLRRRSRAAHRHRFF